MPCLLTSEGPNKRTLDIFCVPPHEIHKSRVFMIGPAGDRNESRERFAWKHYDLLTKEKHAVRPVFQGGRSHAEAAARMGSFPCVLALCKPQ